MNSYEHAPYLADPTPDSSLTGYVSSSPDDGGAVFRSVRQDWGRWSPWGRFCHLRRQIDQLIYGEIRDRKANYDPDRADILNNFLPFGGGIRRCIGEALALFELKLVLATVLCRYQLALANPQPERPRRRGVSLVPGQGVRMVFLGRR